MCASHGALRSRSNSPPRGLVMQEESLDDRTCSVTPLFPEHKIDQRFVDMQVAVVMNEAFFPELAHEGTNLRPRGADHLGKGFVGDPRNGARCASSFADA